MHVLIKAEVCCLTPDSSSKQDSVSHTSNR